MREADVIDEALEILAPYAPELANGNTNHAPMAVEALCSMGRADAALPWLERYRHALVPRARPSERIPREEWRRFLGRSERVADWTAFFENELAEAPWRDVAARWTTRFAPGFSAAAMHGVLRAGHAVRSLGEGESPARVRELAEGLGYWASTYQELPRAAGRSAPTDPRSAIGRVALVPPERRRFAGSITSSFDVLAEFPEFGSVIDAIDVSGSPAATISRMTEAFAQIYLANAHDVLTAIVFIHGVTGVAAVRSLLAVLDDATARDVVRHGWHASAALYATFGSRPIDAAATIEPARESRDALVDLAIAHGDEHAIKFTEACLREDALTPLPAYGAAARHAIGILPRPE